MADGSTIIAPTDPARQFTIPSDVPGEDLLVPFLVTASS